MKPWQEKALRKGRTPLPDAPGVRPWLDESNDTPSASGTARTAAPALARATDASPTSALADGADGATSAPAGGAASSSAVVAAPVQNAEQANAPEASSATPGATGGTGPSYVFWRGDDLRRLVRMRNGGAKWSAIAEAFPDRTLEALKQTFHKRRHHTERLMEEEAAEAAEAEVEAERPNDGQ